MAQKLKVNDTVRVIAGSNKGKTAKITQIDREKGRAVLEGVEVRERHLKRSYLNPTGGKKTVQLGIALSNLKLEKAATYEKPKEKDAKAGKTDKKKKGAK